MPQTTGQTERAPVEANIASHEQLRNTPPRHQSPELKLLFGKFLLTLMSSWIVGPAGVLFLHFWGWGDSPVLIALLLALSAGAPVQLLLNEFVAPGAIAGSFVARPVQVAGVLAATFAAIWFALLASNEVHGGSPFAMAYPLLAVLTTASIWLSYRISLRYYAGIMSGKVGHRAAIYVGIAPGLTTLGVFVLAALAGTPNLLLAAGILPAIVQILILRQVAPGPDMPEARSFETQIGTNRPGLRHIILLVMASLLIAIGIGSTVLRDAIASWQQSYAALILVSLNLMGTIVISFSRAVYLSSGTDFQKATGSAAVIFTFAAVVVYSTSNIASALMALFALQFLVVTVLALGRRRTTSSKPIKYSLDT